MQSPMSEKRLNPRFCWPFGLSVVALCVATHFLHAYQVQRNASAMLDRAHRAKDAGELGKATDYLGRYLGMAPDNIDALAEYALLIADERQPASYRVRMRALFALEKVLYREPQRNDVRRRAIDLEMAPDIRSFAAASDNIRFLLKPQSPGEVKLS